MKKNLLSISIALFIGGFIFYPISRFTILILENINGTEQFKERQNMINIANNKIFSLINSLETKSNKNICIYEDSIIQCLENKIHMIEAYGIINRQVYMYDKSIVDAKCAVLREEQIKIHMTMAVNENMQKCLKLIKIENKYITITQQLKDSLDFFFDRLSVIDKIYFYRDVDNYILESKEGLPITLLPSFIAIFITLSLCVLLVFLLKAIF